MAYFTWEPKPRSWIGASLLLVLLTACGASQSRSIAASRGPDLPQPRGLGTLTPRDLAFGGEQPGRADAHTVARAHAQEIDAFLKRHEQAPARAPRREPNREPESRRAPATPHARPETRVADVEAVFEPERGAALPPPPVLAAVRAPETARDLEGYAQREQRSRELRDYRGGDAIVISTGTLVLALLVVLLVVLLT